MKAVVFGATGAIGREVVGELLTSGKWSQVVTVGRRPVEVPAAYPPDSFKAELQQVVVDMDKMETAAASLEGADAVFCGLGTTRKDAGSAEAFKRVDFDYVKRSAELSKAAGARYYGLVSAVGANAKLWASDLQPFHGLLYAKTKGLAEEAAKAQGFERTAIFRPGMLERGELSRPVERWFKPFMSSIKVRDVAKVMVADAERCLTQGVKGTSVVEMRELMKIAKELKQQ